MTDPVDEDDARVALVMALKHDPIRHPESGTTEAYWGAAPQDARDIAGLIDLIQEGTDDQPG